MNQIQENFNISSNERKFEFRTEEDENVFVMKSSDNSKILGVIVDENFDDKIVYNFFDDLEVLLLRKLSLKNQNKELRLIINDYAGPTEFACDVLVATTPVKKAKVNVEVLNVVEVNNVELEKDIESQRTEDIISTKEEKKLEDKLIEQYDETISKMTKIKNFLKKHKYLILSIIFLYFFWKAVLFLLCVLI